MKFKNLKKVLLFVLLFSQGIALHSMQHVVIQTGDAVFKVALTAIALAASKYASQNKKQIIVEDNLSGKKEIVRNIDGGNYLRISQGETKLEVPINISDNGELLNIGGIYLGQSNSGNQITSSKPLYDVTITRQDDKISSGTRFLSDTNSNTQKDSKPGYTHQPNTGGPKKPKKDDDNEKEKKEPLVIRGKGKAPKTGAPNSIYEKLDNENPNLVTSRTTYNRFGKPATREDFFVGREPHTHHNKKTDVDLQNHKHIFEYNEHGQPIGKPIISLELSAEELALKTKMIPSGGTSALPALALALHNTEPEQTNQDSQEIDFQNVQQEDDSEKAQIFDENISQDLLDTPFTPKVPADNQSQTISKTEEKKSEPQITSEPHPTQQSGTEEEQIEVQPTIPPSPSEDSNSSSIGNDSGIQSSESKIQEKLAELKKSCESFRKNLQKNNGEHKTIKQKNQDIIIKTKEQVLASINKKPDTGTSSFDLNPTEIARYNYIKNKKIPSALTWISGNLTAELYKGNGPSHPKKKLVLDPSFGENAVKTVIKEKWNSDIIKQLLVGRYNEFCNKWCQLTLNGDHETFKSIYDVETGFRNYLFTRFEFWEIPEYRELIRKESVYKNFIKKAFSNTMARAIDPKGAKCIDQEYGILTRSSEITKYFTETIQSVSIGDTDFLKKIGQEIENYKNHLISPDITKLSQELDTAQKNAETIKKQSAEIFQSITNTRPSKENLTLENFNKFKETALTHINALSSTDKKNLDLLIREVDQDIQEKINLTKREEASKLQHQVQQLFELKSKQKKILNDLDSELQKNNINLDVNNIKKVFFENPEKFEQILQSIKKNLEKQRKKKKKKQVQELIKIIDTALDLTKSTEFIKSLESILTTKKEKSFQVQLDYIKSLLGEKLLAKIRETLKKAYEKAKKTGIEAIKKVAAITKAIIIKTYRETIKISEKVIRKVGKFAIDVGKEILIEVSIDMLSNIICGVPNKPITPVNPCEFYTSTPHSLYASNPNYFYTSTPHSLYARNPCGGPVKSYKQPSSYYNPHSQPQQIQLNSMLDEETKNKFPCPCCKYYTLNNKPGTFGICRVCFWQDDNQYPNADYEGGANKMSLNTARKNYKKMGAISKEYLSCVRAPLEEEKS